MSNMPQNPGATANLKQAFCGIIAFLVPIFYLFHYTPYGMDTTDFGYFHAYAWRILNGQMPYRDFFT